MSDLIDRQALLEEIENGIRASNFEEGYRRYQTINNMDDIIETIRYADVVQPERKRGRWIPCSERLPKTNGIYIVTRNISDGFEYANITDACYFDGSGTWYDDTRINHARKYLTDVIAWMPLPEPYKDGG